MPTIEIVGKPVAWQRARVNHQTRVHFKSVEMASWQRLVGLFARQAMAGTRPFSGPVSVDLLVLLLPPQSWSAKRRERAVGGYELPATRPDVDNYCKAILDALNNIGYVDDAQVVFLHIAKRYGLENRVSVTWQEVVANGS